MGFERLFNPYAPHACYARLDLLTAENNLAVPAIVDWINRLLRRKLLESF